MNLKFLTLLMMMLTSALGVAVGSGSQQDPPQSAPSAHFPETSYEFKPVLDGAKVVHEFVIQNKGDGTLKVDKVKTG